MHCPRCATTSTANQQFCRACGLRLDKIAELVGEELVSQTSPGTDLARLRDRQKKLENWAGIAGLSTFGVMMVLFIFMVFFKIILQGGLLIIPGVALILLALGATTMGMLQMYSKSLKEKLEEKPLPPSTGPVSIEAPLTFPLPPNSVTEGTTEILEPAKNQTGKI